MTSQQLRQRLLEADTATRSGDHAAAAAFFLHALRLAPDNPDIHFAAGNALRHSGAFDRAAQYFRRATTLRPDFFAAHCNLGASLRQLHRFDDAIRALKKAAVLRPEVTEVSLQLADLYIRMSRPDEARTALETALKTASESAEILNGLGNCAMAKHDLAEAKSFYHRALRLQPGYADAHYNLGTILREWNHLDEAVSCFRHALHFQPGSVAPRVDLGETMQLLGEIAQSEACFKEALAIDPQCDLAWHNLLVSMNYHHAHSAGEVLQAHLDWGNRYGHPAPPVAWPDRAEPERQLTIGYLSPDFCNHPAASFLEPVLRCHNHEQFRSIGYAQTVHTDRRTEQFRKLADAWYPVEHLDDDAVTELIRSHRVDILIDTAGHLNGNRLGVFGRRAAPVQIGGVGYPGLRGLKTIDYRISDSFIDPPETAADSIEPPLLINPCFCCWEPPARLPPVTPLPAPVNGHLTFGSLHTTARLNESVIALWSEVLGTVPSSRLIICRTTLTPSVIARLSAWFTRENIDLTRIDFRTGLPPEGHLTMYNGIDISLDTHPWSGHTTACESLIMGVPVITLFGDRPAGRMVGSVLHTLGLQEWIARSTGEFCAIAARFSSSLPDLAALRDRLRRRVLTSPLCNAGAYTRNLENAFTDAWKKWCTSPR